jgi:hypothetical protein
MAARSSRNLTMVGAGVLLLAYALGGIVWRPGVAIGTGLLLWAALGTRHHLAGQIRLWRWAHAGATALIAVAVLAVTVYWSTQPFFHRRSVLRQLAVFTDEGHRLESDLALGVARSDQTMGDMTTAINDWHRRAEAFIERDLGPFYLSKFATPHEIHNYPAGLPARFNVFWDILEGDLAGMREFTTEFSRWFFF